MAGLFKKTISDKDDEFIIRLEEEDIRFVMEEMNQKKDLPQTYVYCHIKNKYSDSLGWLTIENIEEIYSNLDKALETMKAKNKELGWK